MKQEVESESTKEQGMGVLRENEDNTILAPHQSESTPEIKQEIKTELELGGPKEPFHIHFTAEQYQDNTNPAPLPQQLFQNVTLPKQVLPASPLTPVPTPKHAHVINEHGTSTELVDQKTQIVTFKDQKTRIVTLKEPVSGGTGNTNGNLNSCNKKRVVLLMKRTGNQPDTQVHTAKPEIKSELGQTQESSTEDSNSTNIRQGNSASQSKPTISQKPYDEKALNYCVKCKQLFLLWSSFEHHMITCHKMSKRELLIQKIVRKGDKVQDLNGIRYVKNKIGSGEIVHCLECISVFTSCRGFERHVHQKHKEQLETEVSNRQDAEKSLESEGNMDALVSEKLLAAKTLDDEFSDKELLTSNLNSEVFERDVSDIQLSFKTVDSGMSDKQLAVEILESVVSDEHFSARPTVIEDTEPRFNVSDEDKLKVDRIKTTTWKMATDERTKDPDTAENLDNLVMIKSTSDPEMKIASFSCKSCSAKFPTWLTFYNHSCKHKQASIKLAPAAHKKALELVKRRNVNKTGSLKLIIKAPVRPRLNTEPLSKRQRQIISPDTIKIRKGNVRARETPPVRNLTCETCGRCYKHRSQLRLHRLTHGPPLYFCEYCGYGCHYVQNLNHHIRNTHLKLRPQRCMFPSCGKRFANRTQLATHSTTHSSEKNLECEKCKKKYKTKGQLRQHMISHQPAEKHHSCSFCSQTFSYACNMRMHIKNVHQRAQQD